MSVGPAAPAAATIFAIASLFLLSPQWGGTVYVAALILMLFVVQCGGTALLARRLIAWTAPIVLPLLIVHGVFNSQFPITSWWMNTIPIRDSGLAFSYDLAIRFLLFSVVAAYWLLIDRDAMVEVLLRTRLPTPLIMLVIQGFVMGRLLQEKIEQIHLAQRARGIPVSATPFRRIVSLPALLIPAVVGTFIEAEARVPVLLAHGYGRLEPSTRSARLDLRTALLALAMPICLIIALLVDGSL